jgi:hypothetical protein
MNDSPIGEVLKPIEPEFSHDLELQRGPGPGSVWPFWDRAGTQVTSFSNSRQPLTLTAATWTRGLYGPAVAFNGTSSTGYAAAAATPVNNQTWLIRFMPTNINSTFQCLACVADAGNTNPLKLYIWVSNQLALYQTGQTVGTTTLVSGTWYVVAMVLAGTTARIYLNGSLEATGTFSVPLVGVFEIGASSSVQYLFGLIDYCELLPYALSADDVAIRSLDIVAGVRPRRSLFAASPGTPPGFSPGRIGRSNVVLGTGVY